MQTNHITRKRTLTSDHRLQEATNKGHSNVNFIGYLGNEENGIEDTGRLPKTAFSDSSVDAPVSSSTFSETFDKWLISTSQSNLIQTTSTSQSNLIQAISTSQSNLIQTMTTSSKPSSHQDTLGLLETAPSCSGIGLFHIEKAELDKQIENNKTECRIAEAEAEMLRSEKKGLEQQLGEIEKRISNHLAEKSEVSKFRRISTEGAKTGRSRKTAFYKFGAPYFKSKEGFPTDHNEDLKEAIDQNQIMTILLPNTPDISNRDVCELKRNIVNQLKAKRADQLKELLKLLSDGQPKTAAHEQLESSLRADIATIEHITTVEEVENFGMSVDYRLLASYSQRFSSDDYERMWRLLGHPSLSKKAFSNVELEKLQDLANKNNNQDWDLIARELNTNRNGYSCFLKHMSLLRRKRNEAWTKEEDDLLRKLGSKLRSIREACARYHWWSNIRQQFPNRSYMQILDHWRYSVKPKVKKARNMAEKRERANRVTEEGTSVAGASNAVRTQPCVPSTSRLENLEKLGESNGAWNKDEEKLLFQLIRKHGKTDWERISQEMKTRSPAECRLKHQLYLKRCLRKRKLWTENELKLFKKLLGKYGPNFVKISEEMEKKTPQQCRSKYHILKKKQ